MWQKAGIKYQELCPKNPGQTSGDDLRYATNSEGHVTITRNEGEKGDARVEKGDVLVEKGDVLYL